MKFYITTDGYLDQNGGEKGFPFGKKRFKKLIKENYKKPMKIQKEIFIKALEEYKGDYEQNDDITLIGFEIGQRSDVFEREIFSYEGVITQNVINVSLENIENSIDNISIVGKLSTIVIEMCQNIMHYSNFKGKLSYGFVEVKCLKKDGLKIYQVITKNMVSKEVKEKIENRLNELIKLNKEEIRKKYRELRRSGKHSHKKGGGIGFYEIAKVADELNFEFENKKEGYLFILEAKIVQKKG
jgi:uncharacterized protein Veg